MKIRTMFGKVFNALKSVGALRFKISHSSLVLASILFLILFIAFMVRLLPLRWGFHLSEFDPHFHYRLARHMVDNGFTAWTDWVDYARWYPAGQPLGKVAFPGLAATAAFFYMIGQALGLSMPIMHTYNPLTTDPLFNFCVVFPAIMGALTCLVIFFLGKDIGGNEVGLFSALFLALNSSYIGRTSLGFFDDETVGIFGILLFIFFFLRAIQPERSLRNGLSYAVAAGLSLGYLFASWGAARYPLGMIVLFVFVLILLRRYSSRLFMCYSTTFGIALFIAVNIPKLGTDFLTEPTVLAVSGVFLLLCIYEASRYIKTPRMKAFLVFGLLSVFVVSFFALSQFGYISPIGGKFLSVLNPMLRLGPGTGQQLVQSVQEHRPAAWGTFYYDFGIGVFFVVVGLFFAVQNPTNRNLFLCIFGLTSVYFASSMVRLTLLVAPALCLIWALGLVRILRPFVTIIKETPAALKRKMRLRGHVGREFSGAFMIMIFLLLTFTLILPSPNEIFTRAINHAYSPTTIAAGSMPLKPPRPVADWIGGDPERPEAIGALNWMRVNLEPTDVVAAWWDYGYWITIIANKTSLADNGTTNATQIAQIGLMFMSNETEAIKILERFGATYVVVFTTFQGDGTNIGWGDEGKWTWMAKISGSKYGYWDTDFVKKDPETGEPKWGEWNDRGNQTVIYKLMTYGKEVTLHGSSRIVLEHFEGPPEGYFSQIAGAPKDYSGAIPLVCVYKIKYD